MIDRDFAFVHYHLKESGIISFNPLLQAQKTFGSEVHDALGIRSRDIHCDETSIFLQR